MRPTATLGEYKGVEVGSARAGGRRRGGRRRARARCASARARLETVEDAAADEGDFVVMDYVRLDRRRRPFAGGEGRDQLIELGSGRLVPGFEEQLDGRQGRRRAHGHGHLPRRLRRRASSPGKRGRVRGHRQGGQAQGAARARRRLRLRRGRLRHARRAARGHRGRAARGRRDARRGRVPRGRRSTPSSRDATVEVPDALVEARARELWDRMLHSLSPPGHHARDATCGSPAATRTRSSRRPSPTPSRRCAARP